MGQTAMQAPGVATKRPGVQHAFSATLSQLQIENVVAEANSPSALSKLNRVKSMNCSDVTVTLVDDKEFFSSGETPSQLLQT